MSNDSNTTKNCDCKKFCDVSITFQNENLHIESRHIFLGCVDSAVNVMWRHNLKMIIAAFSVQCMVRWVYCTVIVCSLLRNRSDHSTNLFCDALLYAEFVRSERTLQMWCDFGVTLHKKVEDVKDHFFCTYLYFTKWNIKCKMVLKWRMKCPIRKHIHLASHHKKSD